MLGVVVAVCLMVDGGGGGGVIFLLLLCAGVYSLVLSFVADVAVCYARGVVAAVVCCEFGVSMVVLVFVVACCG